MKKRIGNDIHFVWTVKRKNGDILTPETFEGKDVQLKLISPMKQEAVIEDVVFSTGQISWTFRGKHQMVLGTYIAILCENRGENNMVTIDEVEAVTLVRHTYQETENEDGNITSDSAEFETTINDSSGTPIDAYTKDETDELLAGKVDVLQIQDGYTASRYMSGTSFSDNSDQQGRVRSAAYEVGGITLVDLNGNIAILQVNGVLQLNGKALATEDDTALLVDGGDYNSQSKEIELKHGNTVLARIDARAFVKDGMVDSVVIENGYIVITFNTDAGKEAISLALTDIFNPANYYDKTAMNALLAGKQDTINDLATIRSGAQAGATAYQKPATGIPATDLASDVQTDLAAIDGIEAVIPEQASASNKLADKNFVNSSIATATATYRGSYNLVSDLLLSVSTTQQQIADALATKMEALSITPDNNDYSFVQIPTADATPTEIARIDRYKYDGTAWAYEYSLNNSSFTAAQWAALNSGITSGLVTKLSVLPTNSELTTLLSGKANTADLAPVATSGNYNDLTGRPTVDNTPTPNSNNLVKSGGVYSTTPSITNTDAESDLDISDEDGNVLIRFKNGGVRTKNFDSSKDATTEERGLMSSTDKAKLDSIEEGAEINDVTTDDTESSDLDFADEDNNVLVRFANGHIKTKNFDSQDVNILERALDSEMGNKDGATSVALTYNYISLLNSASEKDGKITKIEIKTEGAGNTTFAIAMWDETHGFIDIKEQFSLAVESGINSLSINKNVPKGYQLFIIGGIKPIETNASKHIIAGNENIGDSDNNIIERQTSCYLAWNVHYDEVTVKQGFEMMSSDVNTISEEVAVCNDKVSKLNDTIDLTDENNVRYKIKVINGQLTLERLTIAYSKILVIAHSYGCILGGAWDRGMSSTKVSTDWVHQILNPLGVETLDRVNGVVWEQNQGNPTAVLSAMLDSHLAVDDIDAVFIMLGANIPTQYRTPSIATTNYSELIYYINSRSSADIYVCSPGYTDETDPFNIAIRNAATSNGATYIETYWVNSEKYATMGDAMINASDDSYWFVNSAGRENHPNDKWHLYMANKILVKLGHGGLDKVHNINVQAAQGKSYHCYSSWVAGGRCSIVIYDSVAPNISVQTINGESIIGVMVDLNNANIPSISPMPKFTYHFDMPNKDINITIN